MVAFSTISSAAWARQAISFIANSIHGSHGTDEYQRLVLSCLGSHASPVAKRLQRTSRIFVFTDPATAAGFHFSVCLS